MFTIGTAVPTTSTSTSTRTVRPRRLYVLLSFLIAAIAVTGFWTTYFGPLFRGKPDQPMLLHVHAAVFVGWLVLFLAQAVFASMRRMKAHLAIGRIGIGYGVLLVAVGVWTTISRSAHHLRTGGDGEGLLFVALLDMVIFSAFFGAAIVYRRRPQIHKRLMVVAATMLLIAAVGRLWFLPAPPLELLVSTLVWFSPVLVAMAHDHRSTGRVHPVYVIGLAAFLVRLFSPDLVVGTASWSSVAQYITGLAP